MATTTLHFVNKTEGNANINVFLSNPADENISAKAWQTFTDMAPGETRTVQVDDTGYAVQAYITGNGNGSDMTAVTAGLAYKAVNMGTKPYVAGDGNAKNAMETQILNDLGSQMTVDLFNNGNNIGMGGAQPGGTAIFVIGQEMYLADVAENNLTRISYSGLASATVIIGGENGQARTFTLENTATV